MKINLLLFPLLLLGCSGPKAFVSYETGEKILVKKIKSDGEPLLFRRDGGAETQLNLKALGSLTVIDSPFVVYSGDSWQRVVITYKKDDKQDNHTGWIKSSASLMGRCPAGECDMPISSLSGIDFLMKEQADTTADTTATE